MKVNGRMNVALVAAVAGLSVGVAAGVQPDDGIKSGDLLRPVPPEKPGDQAKPADPVKGAAGRPAPGTKPATPGTPPPADENIFRFGPFPEPVKVKLLLDTVVDLLKIQVIGTDKALGDKDILLPTVLEIPRDQLLRFLSLLLEQNGQTLSRDPATGIYFVRPSTEMIGQVGKDDFSTTRIITTMGLKPSSMANAINVALKSSGAAPGAPPAPGQGSIAYLDDLGVIIMTDAPRRIQTVVDVVNAIGQEQAAVKWTRFKIRHVAAPTARTR
ncbi:MAG: hypothetical protein JNJ48_00695, partial [Phycisphaerae bacterium]|nr:hypothetical protein [Phycisphaerae bacterium]